MRWNKRVMPLIATYLSQQRKEKSEKISLLFKQQRYLILLFP